MNEKLIKAQTRIAQQSAANSDPVSGGMDYKELYKRVSITSRYTSVYHMSDTAFHHLVMEIMVV